MRKGLERMTYKQLWHYSLKLKEGGKAWDAVMNEMEKRQLTLKLRQKLHGGK